MTSAPVAKHRIPFLTVAAIILVLGALSAMDVNNQPYWGYGSDDAFRVTNVDVGSPAAAAGLRAGDVLKTVANGIAVTDTKAMGTMPRATVGETQQIVVERSGQTVTLQVTAARLPAKNVYLARALSLTGLCFLVFPLWAYLAAPGVPTTLLACVGLSCGFSMLGVPYFASAVVRLAVREIDTLVAMYGLAALLHFLLAFPSRQPVLKRAFGTSVVYGPAAVFALLSIGAAVVRPPFTSPMMVLLRLIEGLLYVGYFITAIVVLVRRFVTAPAVDRWTRGPGLMLGGAVVGLVPFLAVLVVMMVSPKALEPWSEYTFLTLGLIPITFAMAVVQSARQSRT